MPENQPRVFRISISDQFQINLPEFLVQQIGSESGKVNKIQGAFTVWYYHSGAEKIVLAPSSVQRDSLEQIQPVPLQGISNEDLANGDVESARVTMGKAVRKKLGKKARSINNRECTKVVLRPIYVANHPRLNGTCVSVYPADLYDNGELPNVLQINTSDDESTEDSTNTQSSVGTTSQHANSV
jgi:hypothetical protein